jgi:hypothetical protein
MGLCHFQDEQIWSLQGLNNYFQQIKTTACWIGTQRYQEARVTYFSAQERFCSMFYRTLVLKAFLTAERRGGGKSHRHKV